MAEELFDAARTMRDLRRGVRLTPAQLTWQLCSATSHEKSGALVAALLAAGADPNAASGGRPPLMWAMMSGNVAAVRVLCAAGADVHARSAGGDAGLVMSVFHAFGLTGAPDEHAYVDVLRALSDAGRDITRCVAEGRAYSPLGAAANRGLAKLLQLLLKAGAPVDATTGNNMGATALHFATNFPISSFDSEQTPPADTMDRCLQCVRRLLRAGADTRLRRFDGAVAAEAVLVYGDLRVADMIFAAEEKRGIAPPADEDDDASRRWPEHVQSERALRAAVAAYRRTGDAALPLSLRQVYGTRLSQVDRPRTAAETARCARAGGGGALPPLVGGVAVAGPFRPTEALRAALAPMVPRGADADARRCAAPGCAVVGALLKPCPCRSAWYCSRTCQVTDWRAHRATAAHKQGVAGAADASTSTSS